MKRFSRSRLLVPILICCLILVVLPSVCAGVGEGIDPVCDEIERRLTGEGSSPREIQGQRILTCPAVLQHFYAERFHQPVWINGQRLLPEVQTLLEAIRRAGEEGLRSDHYLHVAKDFQPTLSVVLKEQSDMPQALIVDIDILLTDAFVSLGHDLSFGRVNTELACGTDCLSQRQADLLTRLEESLNDGLFGELLCDLAPQDPAYRKLKDILARYRQIAGRGGWPSIPPGGSITQGDRNVRIAALRERLRISGDLVGETPESATDYFDETVAEAVRRFQKRHGLAASGAVNEKTLRILNRPVEDDIRQIELNLERWRWLPHDLGSLYVMVNIPDFSLKLVESGETVLSMRTVIGKPFWHTPFFSGRMTYLEINPSWKIPPSILAEEIIPSIKRNPEYIRKKNIKFFSMRGKSINEIAPEQINWTKVRPRRFPYFAVQQPGPANPLGRVKFIFPNKNDVYLHDTPTKYLFRRDKRTFSHGCIRIEKPFELAAYLLERDQDWSKKRLMAEVRKGKTRQVVLRAPVGIHIVYFTAWVDEEGALQTRPDVYNSDQTLEVALKKWEELSMGISLD